MKYIKSKKLSENKYELTVEVTEFDMLMMEDLHSTMTPYKQWQDLIEKDEKSGKAWKGSTKEEDRLMDAVELTPKYKRFTDKLWKTFWKLWEVHDDN